MAMLDVKAIAYGGIADEKAGTKLMQHVGGVKGSQVWDWDTFQSGHVERFIENPAQYDFLPKRLPILHDSSMNLRNSYQPNSDLPLEFTFQPANGHLYITKEMWEDRGKLWAAAAAMAWGSDGKSKLPGYKENMGSNGNKEDTPGDDGDKQKDGDKNDVTKDDVTKEEDTIKKNNKLDINSLDELTDWGKFIAAQFNFDWGFNINIDLGDEKGK